MRANRYLTCEKAQLDPQIAVGSILIVVLAAAFLIIGTVVLQGIVDSKDFETYNRTTHEGDRFQPVITSLTTAIESAMGLGGTLLLVVIGVSILMLLAGVMAIMAIFK